MTLTKFNNIVRWQKTIIQNVKNHIMMMTQITQTRAQSPRFTTIMQRARCSSNRWRSLSLIYQEFNKLMRTAIKCRAWANKYKIANEMLTMDSSQIIAKTMEIFSTIWTRCGPPKMCKTSTSTPIRQNSMSIMSWLEKAASVRCFEPSSYLLVK